jgi:lysophospholipase
MSQVTWGWTEPQEGIFLRWGRWAPQGEARATIVVIPGRTEFIEKYTEVLEGLAELGLVAWCLDLRGQGHSTRVLANPHKGHIDSFQTYNDDILHWMQDVILADPEAPQGPRLLLGHSVGGLLGLRYMIDHPEHFSRAVISSPMMGVTVPAPDWLVLLVAQLLVRLGYGESYVGRGDYGEYNRTFQGNPWTSDPERLARTVSRVRADPTVALGGITIGWLAAALEFMQETLRPGKLEALSVPTLVVASGDDHCVDGAVTMAELPRVDAITLELLTGSQHEILFERDLFRQTFWDRMVEFFDLEAP